MKKLKHLDDEELIRQAENLAKELPDGDRAKYILELCERLRQANLDLEECVNY